MAWRNQNGFFFDIMNYRYSCFASCLGMALQNIGIQTPAASIEQRWNTLQLNAGRSDLNTEAPDLTQVAANILATIGPVVTQVIISKGGGGLTAADNITIAQHFGQDSKAMIFSMVDSAGHANLFLRNAAGQYLYVKPEPDWSELVVVFVERFSLKVENGAMSLDYAGPTFNGGREDDGVGGDYVVLIG